MTGANGYAGFMPIGVALIRGINVGGKNMLPMEVLRELCDGAGLCDAQTYIQSGNLVFRADARAMKNAAAALSSAIERRRTFSPVVVVRTIDEVRRALEANPLPIHGADKSRVMIMFLSGEPVKGAGKAVAALDGKKERVVLAGREAYLHFPDGVAASKLTMAAVEKALGVHGTCRNLNTVEKLIAMGEGMTR
jgi:uncharacterized protein (DUF1697 family)